MKTEHNVVFGMGFTKLNKTVLKVIPIPPPLYVEDALTLIWIQALKIKQTTRCSFMNVALWQKAWLSVTHETLGLTP